MRISSSALAVVLSGVLLAACSNGGTSTSTAPAGGGGAVGKPHYGGTIRVGSQSAASTLLSLYSNVEGSANDLVLVYDTLVNVDPDFKVVPWIASSWEVSKDVKTYTFHLRHNAAWSDGVPITSADQLFEYQVTTNPLSSAPYKSDYDEVESCTAPDKWTVVYKLKSPDASFAANVVAVLPHAPLPVHIYGKYPVNQLQHLDLLKHFVGSGPWIVTDWKADDHMTLTSNKHWWHGRPYIDQVYFKQYLNETALITALQNGEVDTGYQLTTPQWLKLKNDPNFWHIHQYFDGFDWWVTNDLDPILKDVNVRQAMMYGWDRKTEAEKLFHGEDIPAFTPIPLALKWASSPKALTAYPYDPKKAAAILDADGWTMGTDGVRHKNGVPLAFMVGLISGNEISVREFEFVQANLKSIGIKLTTRQTDINVFYQDEQNGKFQIDVGGFSVSNDPDPYGFMHSKAIPPAGLNYARFSDPKVDDLILAARQTADVAKRTELYYKLQDLIIADCPVLWSVEPYYRNVVNKRIAGVDPAKAGSAWTATIYYMPEWWVTR
jgi:peptide/nickel transport system substrate-binding protein